MRKLGSTQLSWLKALARKDSGFPQGVFYFGMGRIWTNESQTRKLCESLERAGMLKCVKGEHGMRSSGHDTRRWEVTELGYQTAGVQQPMKGGSL